MQLKKSKMHTKNGDTLIEVMFAVSIFAMIAVGCVTIMNQGVATAQRSLEVTLVRQQIDSQAETLRYLNSAYVAQYKNGVAPVSAPALQWNTMVTTYGKSAASSFGGACPAAVPNQSFVFDTHTAKVAAPPQIAAGPGSTLPPFAQVAYDPVDGGYIGAFGLWIEAVRPSPISNYLDFHIRACWDGPGSNAPMTLGTIVRLYEPR